MAESNLDQIGEIALQIMTAAKGYLTSKAGNTLGSKVWEKLRHIISGSEECQSFLGIAIKKLLSGKLA